jgi:hypothetical protein
MRYNLKAMWRRAAKPRRREVVFRNIVPPAMLATDLYTAAYAPVVAAWENAVPDIMAAYRRALSAQTTDSPADATSTINAVDADIARLAVTLRLRTQNWAVKVEKWQRSKWVGAVKTATTVDVSDMIGAGDVRATLGTAIEGNVALISSVSDQARGRISESVFRGLRNRSNPDDVAKEIYEATGMARRRAQHRGGPACQDHLIAGRGATAPGGRQHMGMGAFLEAPPSRAASRAQRQAV